MSSPYAEVIGDPVGHSLSPVIHRFWLKKLGIEADYRATRVSVAELPGFLAERRGEAAWRGCNVTMPLKQAVLPLLDVVEDGGVRAVNCIVPTAAGQVGRNSDVDGVREAFALGGAQSSEIHLIGTGGAARAVMSALREHKPIVFGRDAAKARALSVRNAPLSALLEPIGDTQGRYVVINASSLGMMGHPPLPIRLERYPAGTVVIDLVYNPLDTPLLRAARELGMVTVDGLVMLIGQAAAAFEMFFGEPAPREHDAELRALLTA